MRHTSSHTKNRRSHHALVGTKVVVDKESGAHRLPHRLDETTGMYRGKQIVSKREVKEKKVADKKREKAHAHDHGGASTAVAEKHTKMEEREKKQSKGVLGNLMKGRSTARSGMGGQAGS